MTKSSNNGDKDAKIPMEGPPVRKQSILEKQVSYTFLETNEI